MRFCYEPLHLFSIKMIYGNEGIYTLMALPETGFYIAIRRKVVYDKVRIPAVHKVKQSGIITEMRQVCSGQNWIKEQRTMGHFYFVRHWPDHLECRRKNLRGNRYCPDGPGTQTGDRNRKKDSGGADSCGRNSVFPADACSGYGKAYF